MARESADWLTIAQAADLIRRERSTVWRWTRNGLPSHRVAGITFVDRGDLLDYAAKHGRRRGRAREWGKSIT